MGEIVLNKIDVCKKKSLSHFLMNCAEKCLEFACPLKLQQQSR